MTDSDSALAKLDDHPHPHPHPHPLEESVGLSVEKIKTVESMEENYSFKGGECGADCGLWVLVERVDNINS